MPDDLDQIPTLHHEAPPAPVPVAASVPTPAPAQAQAPGMDDLDYSPTLRGLRAGMKVFAQRYSLERQLGRGGMGVVWQARDAKLSFDVALKFLPETLQDDDVAVEDLRNETKRCLQLTHPLIVRTYDLMEGDGMTAISMEYVNGLTLNQARLKRPGKVFDTTELLPWVQQICEALSYAHTDARMVHRDIKPSNIMINSATGRVKLADFGIASGLSETLSRMTRAGHNPGSGTLVYMSPQQLIGLPPAVSDDIYSLGATLYELLTGKPPFFRGSIERQIEAHMPPSLAERRAELQVQDAHAVPEAWERVVRACLEKEREKRPVSAQALWESLVARPVVVEEVPVIRAPAPLPAAVPVAVAASPAKQSPARAPVLPTQRPQPSVPTPVNAAPGREKAKAAKPAEAAVERTMVSLLDVTWWKLVIAAVVLLMAVSYASFHWFSAGTRPETMVAEETSGSSHTALSTPASGTPTVEPDIRSTVLEYVAQAQAAMRKLAFGEARDRLEIALRLDASSAEALEAMRTLEEQEAAERAKAARASAPSSTTPAPAPTLFPMSAPTVIAASSPPPTPTVTPTPPPSPPPAPAPVLPATGYFPLDELFDGTSYDEYNVYSRSRILEKAQEKFKLEGLYQSAADGDPGPGTQQAIIAWQRRNGLRLTGKLDDETQASLNLHGLRETTPKPVTPSVTSRKSTPAPRPVTPVVRPAAQQQPSGLSPQELEALRRLRGG